MKKSHLFLLLLGLLLAGAAVYRWVDEEGRVHYSDLPPKGVLPKVEPPSPPPKASESAAPPAAAPAQAAVSTLNTYVLSEGSDPQQPSFRLAIAVLARDGEAAEVEAEFENPADGGAPLAGARREWPGGRKDQFLMVSAAFGAIQCRSYAVTVRVYPGGNRSAPPAVLRDSIVSRIDSSLLAAGGIAAERRVERGEPVCPG